MSYTLLPAADRTGSLRTAITHLSMEHTFFPSPPLASLAPGAFLRRVVESNGLTGISRFLFPPGSLFGAPLLWWRPPLQNRPARRPHSHEGIDLCWMEADSGIRPIDSTMEIPALLPGQLLHFHRDFLGETLYIQHPGVRQGRSSFYTVFGHMQPGGWRTGASVTIGRSLGTINACSKPGKAPAHLHLSCCWIADGFPPQALSWETLATSDAVRLIDPFPLLMQAPEALTAAYLD